MRVTKFNKNLGRTGHDVACAWLKGNMAEIPDAEVAACPFKPPQEICADFNEGNAGVFAQVHGRGAGMIRLAAAGNPRAANADDGRYQTDFFCFNFKSRPLLNMAFKVGQVPFGIDACSCLASIARFVECLSTYARQFLGRLERPPLDDVSGLAPAIAIDQKTASRNPRSTVGTVTVASIGASALCCKAFFFPRTHASHQLR